LNREGDVLAHRNCYRGQSGQLIANSVKHPFWISQH
jgi:hypothetical protein